MRRFRKFQAPFKTPARRRADSGGAHPTEPIIVTLNTQFARPAVVMLSAMWALAALLAVAALAVNWPERTRGHTAEPAASLHVAVNTVDTVDTVDTRPSSSMLRESAQAVAKDKLD